MTYLGLTSYRLPAALLALLLACDGKDGVLTSHVQDTDTSTSSDESTTAPPTGSDPTTDASSDTTSPSEPTTDDADTTTDAQPLCECIVDDPEDRWQDPTLPTCVETICPVINAVNESICDAVCTGGITVDSAALECALVALRDRVPGLIRWHEDIKDNEAYRTNGYLWIRDDGTAIRRSWKEYDLTFMATAAQIAELPPSATYEQCLAGDDKLRFECMRQPFADPDDFICDEAWSAEGI